MGLSLSTKKRTTKHPDSSMPQTDNTLPARFRNLARLFSTALRKSSVVGVAGALAGGEFMPSIQCPPPSVL